MSEGRVYVRGGRWWMDWTDGGGTRHRRSLGLPGGAKEGKAKRALAAFKAEVEAERAVRGSGLLERLGLEAAPTSGEVPFSGLAARWLEDYALRAKPLTVYGHRRRVERHLYPYFGHGDARLLDAAALLAFQRHLAHGERRALKPQSVNVVMSTVRLVLEYGHRAGLLARPPAMPTHLRPQTKEAQWWTIEERDHLLDAVRRHEPAWWPFFALAFSTGLRRGELLALRWSDVTLASGEERVYVRRTRCHIGEGTTKGGHARLVWVGALGAEALQAQRAALEVVRLDGADFVFTKPDGRPLHDTMARAKLMRLCALAGLPYRPVHALRHSYCSHLVELGASPVEVQQLAGHTSLKTTQTYFHASQRQLQQAAKRLDGTSSVHKAMDNG